MATAIIFASSLFWRGAWAKILSVDTVDILQFVGEALMRNPILSRCWAGCGYSRLATSRWTKRLKRSELACDERGERGRRPPFNGSDDVPVWLSRMSGASIRRHGCRSPMWQTRLGPAAYFYSAGARHKLRSLVASARACHDGFISGWRDTSFARWRLRPALVNRSIRADVEKVRSMPLPPGVTF